MGATTHTEPTHTEPTHAEPRWFWAEKWQTGEVEAAADLAAGRVETFVDHAALLAALD